MQPFFKLINELMDEEVSLNDMKLMEDEKILREEGRKAEQANTERERLRAENAEAMILRLQEEIKRLKDGEIA